MLIRSQDKKHLINLAINDLHYYGELLPNNEYEFKILSEKDENNICILGFYSSEEKAIKVLDMIVKQAQTCTKLIKTIRLYAFEPYESMSTVVFQIPQDCEVKV